MLVSAFGRTYFDLDHCALYESFSSKGPKGKIYSRGITADSASVTGVAQLFAMKLGQAVDETSEPLGRRMLPAIPPAVCSGVSEPKIG
jgi:hypothetical protein